jgi:hypothetical protein
MKLLLLPLSLACVALSGCVAYGDQPYGVYGNPGYTQQGYQVYGAPGYPAYGNPGYPPVNNSGYYGGATVYGTQPYPQGYAQPYGADSRDRDGDGVRNRDDRYPDDPRRY